MDFFDTLSRKIPAIGFLSLIISSIYNAGFLSASSSIDLMSSLSYQDIIISSLYIFPILILLLGSFNSIYNMVLYMDYIDRWWKYIILLMVFTIGVGLFVSNGFRPDSWAWIIVIFSVSPFVYKLFLKFGIDIDRKMLGFVAVFITISVVSYSDGYASFRNRQCVDLKFIDTENCKNCLLLKIYSNIIVMKKGSSESIYIENNKNNYEIRIDEDATMMAIQTPYCNPLREWIKVKS